jgi:hypothetical protein
MINTDFIAVLFLHSVVTSTNQCVMAKRCLSTVVWTLATLLLSLWSRALINFLEKAQV